MAINIEYPLNLYSRVVTNSTGTGNPFCIFLCHNDRALVTAGSVFVDQSSWDNTVFVRGTAVIQSQAAAFFSTGGVLFNRSSTDTKLVWNLAGIVGTTATDDRPAMQIETLFYVTSINTAGMYVWDINNGISGVGADNGRAVIVKDVSSTDYILEVLWSRHGIGDYFNHRYIMATVVDALIGPDPSVTFASGTWMHLSLVRVDGVNGQVDSPGDHQVGIFLNGLQLSPIAGGFPSAGDQKWRQCSFANPQGQYLTWGGPYGTTTSNVNFSGYMDEQRVLYDTFIGLSYSSLLLEHILEIPSAPYTPADGTFNITAKTLELKSANLYPSVNNFLTLGDSTRQFKNFWLDGEAFIDAFGESTLFTSGNQLQFRGTSTYLFSSAAGYLTFVAGTQIDLQANIGVSAKNFIFDTVTGVKFGTTTNQKLSFFGVTPVVQQVGNILTALQNLGLVTSAEVPGGTPTITTTSAAYQMISTNQYVIANASGSAYNVTLPAAIGSYGEVVIRAIGVATNAVTVISKTFDNIDEGISVSLSDGDPQKVTRLLDFRGSVEAGGIDSNTKLLIHADGVDGSTSFTDSSPSGHTVTASGNAQVDTAESKFGGGSALFDTANATRLSVASNADWNMGNGDCTWDWWHKPVSLSGTRALISQWGGGGNDGSIYIAQQGAGVHFYYSSDGSNENDLGSFMTITSTTFQHIMFAREGTVLRGFLNGVLQTTFAIGTVAFHASSRPLNISTYQDGAGQAANAWMDEIRIVKGVAKQTASFTPASTAYSTVAASSGQWYIIT